MNQKLKSCKKTLFGYKHNWEKWEIYDSGNRVSFDNKVIGKYIFQKRHCFDCGKIELSKEYV